MHAPQLEDPLKGTVFASSMAQYKILDLLGKGNMGKVYLAENLGTSEIVALKHLDVTAGLAHLDDTRERFRREAAAMQKIKHRNVVALLDFDDVSMFIVMEYLKGQSLDKVLLGGMLPWKRIRNIILQVCDGLIAAHAQKIYHRDIKPENIFLTPGPNDSELVKLVDFGLAKEDSSTSLSLTQTGLLVGTPLYLPPEELDGTEYPGESRSRLLTAREVWSTSAVFYHLLAGDPPFNAKGVPALAKQIMEAPLIPLSKRVPLRGIPPELDDILDQALAKSPFERYESISALKTAISQVKWNGRRKKAWHGSGTKRSPGRFLTRAGITLAVGAGITWGILHPEQLRSFFTAIQRDTYSFYNDRIRPPLVRHNFKAPQLTMPERQYAVSITSNVDSARVSLDSAGKLRYLGNTPLTHTFTGEGMHALVIKNHGRSQRVYVSPKKTDVSVYFAEPPETQK